MKTKKMMWKSFGRDLAWGVVFYVLALAVLFFVFAQGHAEFIYGSF